MAKARAPASDLPLLRWGEELRRRAALRRHRQHIAALAVTSCIMLAPGLFWHPRPVVVWNMSASAPLGLYLLSPGAVRPGDMVAVRPPAPIAAFASRRGYLPAGVALIKKIAAGRADIVCTKGRTILINGARVAMRLPTDGLGRELPSWTGCRRLGADDLFLLMADNPRSFDGRYFGSVRRSDVIGRAALIWRR